MVPTFHPALITSSSAALQLVATNRMNIIHPFLTLLIVSSEESGLTIKIAHLHLPAGLALKPQAPFYIIENLDEYAQEAIIISSFVFAAV